jgi:signal transduction histidine kinase
MNLNILITISITVMLLLAYSVVLFVVIYQRRTIQHQLELKNINEQKQMELLQASLQSEEEERKRIAGELHDDVGATLSSVRLFLHQAEKNSGGSAILKQSGELIDESISKIRNISHKLQPATLHTLGLYSSLHALGELYNRSGKIKLETFTREELPRLPAQTELHVYRIVQELINNIIRHSSATKTSIQVGASGHAITLSFLQDGKGITHEEFEKMLAKPGGIGLKNISNRLQFINGKIFFSRDEKGFYLTELKVPLTD